MSATLDRASSRPALVSTSIGFAMMCVGMFMAILDVQVVATSLPTIQGALAIAPDQMSWVQTAYLIAEVIAIPLTVLLTRVLGMRSLFVLSISAFTAASVGCAVSASFSALIAWRVLQAPLTPLALVVEISRHSVRGVDGTASLSHHYCSQATSCEP